MATNATTRRARKPLNTNGGILWEGRSKLTGDDIVVIATGLKRRSKNPKTGNEIQCWILVKGESPVHARETGKHQAICGKGSKGCPYMGISLDGAYVGTGCYVQVAKAPQSIWLCYQRGGYARITPDVLTGRVVRFGAYGDPAAVPVSLWSSIARVAASWTGYTHQWQWCDQRLKSYLMASVDTEDEGQRAVVAGWRYFRVRNDSTPLAAHEVTCPASAEAGKRVTCEDCRLCRGTSLNARNVVLLPHGTYASSIIPLASLKTLRLARA